MSTLNISYRGMESSESIDFVVREQLEKLQRHCPALQSCDVVVTAPPAKQAHGGHFMVTVALKLPRDFVVADRNPQLRESHENCQSAIRDVFGAALKEVDRIHSRRTDQMRHPH